MNSKKLYELIDEMPYGVKAQIVSYVESVNDALPDIFAQAGVTPTDELKDKLLLLALARKLHAVISSAYFTLDISTKSLASEGGYDVVVGSTQIGRDSKYFLRLKMLMGDLSELYGNSGILDLLHGSFVDSLHAMLSE